MRADGRAAGDLRPISLEPEVSRYAEGSCRAIFGHTQVLCTATVESGVPAFLRNSGRGWVTAEYGMLPRATHSRTDRRHAVDGGRSREISRLIGRSLRAVTDMKALGERQIRIDCDVIQADGGTRTAAITGGFVALHLAFVHMRRLGAVRKLPLHDGIAAISCALLGAEAVLDPNYEEDSGARADANFVLTGGGNLVEIQASGEGSSFSEAEFSAMLALARAGAAQICVLQKQVLADAEGAD